MAVMQTQLAQLSKLKTSLAQVVHLDEFKEIRDKAEALRGYAKTANLGLESQNVAAEVKLRAERGGGELLRDDGPAHGGDRKSRSHDGTLKLQDLGLTRNDSSRWQAIARIPEVEQEKPVNSVHRFCHCESWASARSSLSSGEASRIPQDEQRLS